jgi:hypothetical protein
MMYLIYARKTPRSNWLHMGRTDSPLQSMNQAISLLNDIRKDYRQAGYNWHVQIVTVENNTVSTSAEYSGRVDWYKVGLRPYALMQQAH